MEPDYPAAHSMDTTWYAIDARGNVGVFFSAEDGCVARGADYDDDFFGLVQQLSGGQLDPDEEGLEAQWERAEDLAIQHGLFLYQYVGEFNPLLVPYSVMCENGLPRHVSELPPAFRERVRQVRFDKVDFAEAERLQPVEHVECFYEAGEEELAYLAGDDRTVKPIPGREARFREFCLDFCQRFPERVKDLVFEGQPDLPPKPAEPPKPKKKRKK